MRPPRPHHEFEHAAHDGVRPLGDFPVSVATSFFGIAHAALLPAAVVALAGALVFSLRPAVWRS